jgi:hypothetical protein
MYSDCDIGLSELLYFWPYVWKLDPKHTYDKHPILAWKLGVTVVIVNSGQNADFSQVVQSVELFFTGTADFQNTYLLNRWSHRAAWVTDGNLGELSMFLVFNPAAESHQNSPSFYFSYCCSFSVQIYRFSLLSWLQWDSDAFLFCCSQMKMHPRWGWLAVFNGPTPPRLPPGVAVWLSYNGSIPMYHCRPYQVGLTSYEVRVEIPINPEAPWTRMVIGGNLDNGVEKMATWRSPRCVSSASQTWPTCPSRCSRSGIRMSSHGVNAWRLLVTSLESSLTPSGCRWWSMPNTCSTYSIKPAAPRSSSICVWRHLRSSP